jgi:hypothetical protein
MPDTLDYLRPTPALKTADGEFIDLGWRPVFKEHTNRLGTEFTRRSMEAIARRNNERVTNTGDYCPIVIRHTRDEGDFDPEVIGLAGPYKCQKMPDGTWAVYAKFRVYKEDQDKVRRYPRVSVEYWADQDQPDGGYFDPISLLGAETPELDLGIHYSKLRGRTLVRYQAVMPGGSNTYVPGGTNEKKTRYEAGSMSSEDIQQIVAALTPVIEQTVKTQLAAQNPPGGGGMEELNPLNAMDGVDEAGLGEDGGLGDAFDQALSEAEGGEGGEEGNTEGEGESTPFGENPLTEPTADGDEEAGESEGEEPAEEEMKEESAEPKAKEPKAKVPPKKKAKPVDKYEKYEHDERTGKPSERISAEKAKQILKDGKVHDKPLTEKQRKMFGAASHYEKLCRYEDSAPDEAEQYYKHLDDDSKEGVNEWIACDEDESRRGKMSRHCSAKSGDRYMATDTNVERYQKEAADYRKKAETLEAELDEYRTKYQKEVEERRSAETDLTSLQERVDRIEASERKAVRYQKLCEIANHGYQFEPEEELTDCLDLTDEQFTKHTERIVAKYQRVPIVGLNAKALPLGGPQRAERVGSLKDGEKRERYAKRAVENVLIARAKNEPTDFKTEFERLLAEDPETKLASAAQ